MTIERCYWVCVLASRIGGTLYIGVTNDLLRRVYEHREKLAEGFTKRYGGCRLVSFEAHSTIQGAIRREKRLKKWNRAWTIQLIEENSPNWHDLYPGIARPCLPGLARSVASALGIGVGASAHSCPGDYWIVHLRGRRRRIVGAVRANPESAQPRPASTWSICASLGVR